MLAIETINNEEKLVYTVPTGRTMMVFVDIFPLSSEPYCTIMINDVIYWRGVMYDSLNIKLVLNGGDNIKVDVVDGEISVFVHGIPV